MKEELSVLLIILYKGVHVPSFIIIIMELIMNMATAIIILHSVLYWKQRMFQPGKTLVTFLNNKIDDTGSSQ